MIAQKTRTAGRSTTTAYRLRERADPTSMRAAQPCPGLDTTPVGAGMDDVLVSVGAGQVAEAEVEM
jgi:hypothetical protein